MADRSTVFQTMRFAAAGMVIIACVAAYCIPPASDGGSLAVVFWLVVLAGGALVAAVRAIGERRSAAIGVCVGAILAGGLSAGTGVQNAAALFALAPAMMGMLAYVAGGRTVQSLPEADRASLQTTDRTEVSDSHHQQSNLPEAGTAEGLVVATREFARLHARQSPGHLDWAGFDQFIRQFLRRSFGATRIRCFAHRSQEVDIQALFDESGALHAGIAVPLERLRSSLESGRVMIRDAGERFGEGSVPAAEAPDPDAGDWRWVLPIRHRETVTGIVVVGEVSEQARAAESSAETAREFIELCWNAFRFIGADSPKADDTPGELLGRAALLGRVNEIVRIATEHDPVMVLAVMIEGLRGMDDRGHWAERDALVSQLGRVLSDRVRSDDVVGRFCDDRFVIVLRRLDNRLGTLVAEKLLETIRHDVLDEWGARLVSRPVNAESPLHPLRLRAGLAGTRCAPASTDHLPAALAGAESVAPDEDGTELLERALALLEYAREQRIDMATDMMHGLPPALMRGMSRQPIPIRPSFSRSTDSLVTQELYS